MRRPVEVNWFLVFPSQALPLLPPFHPHSLMSVFGSVQVGCSQFSRCCHLFVDLVSIELGQALHAVTGTRRLGCTRLRLLG